MVPHPVLAAEERSHSGPPLVTVSDKQNSTEAQMVNPPVTQSLAIPHTLAGTTGTYRGMAASLQHPRLPQGGTDGLIRSELPSYCEL